MAMTHSAHSFEVSKCALGKKRKAFLQIKSMIFGSSCFFFLPATFEDMRVSSLNNRRVINTAIFFLEQLLMNSCVNSERESRPSSDASSRLDISAEAEVTGVELNVWCVSSLPSGDGDIAADCCVKTAAAGVDGRAWSKVTKVSPLNNLAKVDGPWCEANISIVCDGGICWAVSISSLPSGDGVDTTADCCVNTVAAGVDGRVWSKVTDASPLNNLAEVDGPWFEANISDVADGGISNGPENKI